MGYPSLRAGRSRKLLSAICLLAQLVPAPALASELRDALASPQPPPPPPSAAALYNGFAGALACPPCPNAATLGEQGRRLERAQPRAPELKRWIEKRIAPALDGLSDQAAVPEQRLAPLRDSLPELRVLLGLDGAPELLAGRSTVDALGGRVFELGKRIAERLGQNKGPFESASVLSHAPSPIRPVAAPPIEPVKPDRDPERERLQEQDRLGQRHDLSRGRPQDAEELAALEELERIYGPLMGAGPRQPGQEERDELKQARLEALRRLFDYQLPAEGREQVKDRPLSPAERALLEEVAVIEGLNGELQGELSARDALAGLLAGAERARAIALRRRRNGEGMLEFRKNFARLAMVMDLTYGLNVILAAEKALAQLQATLDRKAAKIEDRRQANEEARRAAEEQRKKTEAWRAEAEKNAADDRKLAGDFGSMASKAESIGRRISEFKVSVAALLDSIDARDRGRSANAIAEYERRLALLPQIQQALISGAANPDGVGGLSRVYLEAKRGELRGYLADLAVADARLAGAPLEFAGALVVAVPGIPAVRVHNPGVSQVLAILAERRVYWKAQLDDQRKILKSVEDALDPSNSRRVANDFDELVPESLLVYRDEQRALAERLRGQSDSVAGEMDRLAAEVERGSGQSLPRLAGRSADELRELLPGYADRLEGCQFPDTDEGFAGKSAKIGVAARIGAVADFAVRRLEAEATIEALEKPIREILPEARIRFARAVSALEAVLADIAADEAYVADGFPAEQAQALIDRKRALLSEQLRPMLETLKDFIERTLIPFQEERIAQADPNSGDGFGVLYTEKKNLFVRIRRALQQTLPWGLASNGAPEGNLSAANAGIASIRKTFEDYRILVVDFLKTVERRKDPNNAEIEDVYGEPAPYSLARRLIKYQDEKTRRAAEINARVRELGEILAKIAQLSGGKHDLAGRFPLPAEVSAGDLGAPKRLKDFADSRILQNLAAEIQRVADAATAAAAAAGSGGLGVGGSGGTIPTGTLPPPTLSNDQMIALHCLEAVKRLVPTTNGGGGDSLAEALARFLFADALVESSKLNLEVRIPLFETFLRRAQRDLEAVFADLDADSAFVASDLSGGTDVLNRKIAIYALIRAAASEGAALFEQKAGWSAEGVQTAADVDGYYGTLSEVYASGNEALDAELEAVREFKATLAKAQEELRKQKETVSGWLKQLNDPHESALRRVADNLSAIQDQTRAVLEANIESQRIEKEYQRADKSVEGTLARIDAARRRLDKKLAEFTDLGALDPELARRVRAASGRGGSWLAAGAGGPQVVAIPKTGLNRFLGELFGGLSPDSSSRELVALREEILRNPQALAQLLPGSKMIESGGADGFYLVYQTEFSTPYGLESSNQATFGNVAKLWGNNVSVIGHRFASPPSEVNAPFGDQGVTVRVESLQGQNWVNYLDVTFHKFIQDIPGDLSVGSQAKEARMMIFDDFAVMLANDKVYIGAAGFADFALENAAEKPYYYGANLKASVKFTEIMTLKAEESVLFAKDPRKFLQTVNLDFTKYDPDLDADLVIAAEGENKFFRRDKLGLGFDLQKLLETKQGFNLDLYFARVDGTDDIAQSAVGATVLKGFEFDVEGVPVRGSVGGGAELGQKYDSYHAKVGFELPKQGIVLNAQGKILGDGEAYHAELRKRFGESSELFLSYGSRYVGLNNRLTIGAESSFTLGELWRAVAGRAAENLEGGEALKVFNEKLAKFFSDAPADQKLLSELDRVFKADLGKRLLSLRVGELARELGELRRAGAILDNTRMRGMIGFVTNPVGSGTAERATGGGFQLGTQTEISLSKTQRALVANRIASIYRHSLELQKRLLDLAKAWQAALAELVAARWDLYLAAYVDAQADDPVLKAEARVLAAEADGRRRQALLRYNALTGRGPDDTEALDSLRPEELDEALDSLGRLLARSDRLSALLAALPGDLSAHEPGFNLMDWIPFIERLTVTVGAQLQDILANQVIGAAITIRLPIYDPASRRTDKSLALEDRALALEMGAELRALRLHARQQREAAAVWRHRLQELHAESEPSRVALSEAIRGYRNGLMTQRELWARFRRWRWNSAAKLEARVQSSLLEAWASMDAASAGSWEHERIRGRVQYSDSPASEDVEALALRSQAAAELIDSASRRFQKVTLDLSIGLNLTAAGIALIPAFGVTGLAVLPIVGVEFQHDELAELGAARRAGERDYYDRLVHKLQAESRVRLFQSLAAVRAARKIAAAYRALIAELEGAQDGGAGKALELDRARQAHAAALAQLRQIEAAINHGLAGEPVLDTAVEEADLEGELARLAARLGSDRPVDSARAALVSRLEVARSVETIVDKNLKLQQLRLEPVSLIGRSLGRLIAALSGEGLASPELVAMARHQTLDAERQLLAFDRLLPAERRRLSAELERVRRRRDGLGGRREPAALLEDAALESQEYALRAALLAYGVENADARWGAPAPRSWDELGDRLAESYGLEASYGTAPSAPAPIAAETPLEAVGALRYFNHRQSLAKEPIGRHFAEGWVEVRLRSAATPPEALVALAKLREELAGQGRRAELAFARARAGLLMERLRLNAALGRDDAARRAAAEIAARLGFPGTLEDFLRLAPDEAGAAVARYLEEARRVDLELLRKTLFEGGLPLEDSADPLLQLKADLIAERMSYKGFTPVAAFGVFQGRWTGGLFLEAPDPRRIEMALERILGEALRRELESQQRLKELGLLLHSLMASVAAKLRAADAQRIKLALARRNLAGLVERKRLGIADDAAVAAAAEEAASSQEELAEIVFALKLDFVRLVSELEALGHNASALGGPGRAVSGASDLPSVEKSPREELLSWWAERLLDPEFEKSQAARLGSAPEPLRKELGAAVEAHRWARDTELAARGMDYSPAEKIDRLMRIDQAGRKKKVELALKRVLEEMEAQSPTRSQEWTELMGFLREEVSAQEQGSADAARRGASSRRAMREAYWSYQKAPEAVGEAYQRLSALEARLSEARVGALARFLETGKERPEDFVLRDAALEQYVRALIAYDEAVIAAFSGPELSKDPAWARAMDSSFKLSESLARRRALLSRGRALLSIDAAIGLLERRLLTLRAERASPDQLDSASQSLAALRAARERWLARPEELPALYRVGEGEGARWLSGGELERLKDTGRLVELDGRRFVLPEAPLGKPPASVEEARRAGASELVGGVDAAQDELRRRRLRDAAREAARAVAERLERAEIVLVGGDGRPRGELTLAELRRLESEGRVLYYARQPVRGTRPALHPLIARARTPDSWFAIVIEGEPPPPGALPSYEAFAESSWGPRGARAEFGRPGAEALIAEAAREQDGAARRGWLLLKLQGFAYALDPRGELAAVYMSQEELDAALARRRQPDAAERDWAFHRVAALRLGLDARGELCRAEGQGFSRALGRCEPSRWLSGELWGVELGPDGRVARVFESEQELLDESASWWIEDAEGRIWKDSDREIAPVHRLRRYIDPRTGLAVLLGRPLLARRLSQAKDELGDVGRWAYMPWNWGNILLETPRGIVKTPLELITGRDPSQEGYIGRVYMYQGDGGATERRGALGTVLRWLDIFELLPDPVERYHDPSQYPATVDNDGPLKPGEWEHEKSPTTPDRKKNVHFGKGALLRQIGWANEDLDAARGLILASFEGGVLREFVGELRGRSGSYAEVRVDHRAGRVAVEEALDALGARVGPDGRGRVSARPNHLAVDRLELGVRVELGAARHGERRRRLEAWRDGLKTAIPESLGDAQASERALADQLRARELLREAVRAASPRPGLPGFPTVPRLYAGVR